LETVNVFGTGAGNRDGCIRMRIIALSKYVNNPEWLMEKS
jgi:hypothetical protein